jgi:hypothetical protein
MELDQRPRVLGNRYSLRDRLDRGTDEEIWRAHDDVLGREVAISLASRDEAARVDDLIAAARLSDECVERILDAGTAEDGRLCVVTEYVPGQTLRQLLDRGGPLDPERAAGAVAPVLTALQCGHRAGVTHGRVAPERILLGRDGRVRLSGFGLGNGGMATPGDDVRAVGAVLFEAMTGVVPPADGQVPTARAYRAGIPRELDESLRRVLSAGGSRGPEPTAEEFRAQIQRFAGAFVADDEPVTQASPEHSSFFRSWMLVPILLAAAAVVVIIAGLALGRLEVGGPFGIEPGSAAGQEPSPSPERATERIPIQRVSAFDPDGDGTENDSAAPLAADGNRGTSWASENYFDGALNKPGVGLLLDLGEDREITGARLTSPSPGFRFEIGVGESAEGALASAESSSVAGRDARISIDPSVGRYVLVWFTSVVPTDDGYRARVSEVEVVGSRD